MTKDQKKKDVVFAYWEKRISRKVAEERLKELNFEDWEIVLYLDNDHTGPE